MKDMLLKLWIKAQILREDHAQDMVEYALVVGIIALAATASIQLVSAQVVIMWGKVLTALTKANTAIT